jgi:hypothetical protein
MFERLKKTLVKSFVGAIALGWVFAQGILHFAYVCSAPHHHPNRHLTSRRPA